MAERRTSNLVATAGLLACLALLSLGTAAPAGEWDWIPYLQLRTTWSDNIFLAEDEDEVETIFRRHRSDGEASDVIFELMGGARVNYLEDNWRLRTRYQYITEKFADEGRENTEHHDLDLAVDIDLSDAWMWTLGVMGEKHNQLPGAEYLLADYLDYFPFTRLQWMPSERDTVKGQLAWHKRDYEPLGGTPFSDYEGFEVEAEWQHVWSELPFWRTDLNAGWIGREYSQDPLDKDGGREMNEGDREDDRYNAGLALTRAFGTDTAARLGYDFERNDSNGDFYKYSEHQVSLALLRNFHFWEGLSGRIYTHYRWRDYDDQIAQAVIDPYIPTLSDKSEREDRQWYLNVGASRPFWENLKVGLDYSYLSNDSNDDSSEYGENRVWMTLRYEW